jgi:hypothetical protein
LEHLKKHNPHKTGVILNLSNHLRRRRRLTIDEGDENVAGRRSLGLSGDPDGCSGGGAAAAAAYKKGNRGPGVRRSLLRSRLTAEE